MEHDDTPVDKDDFDFLVAEVGRVRAWAAANKITLASVQASEQARDFVRSISRDPLYLMYMDLSAHSNECKRRVAIENYLQAMRTAISRMRNAVKATGTKRRIRQFSVSLKEIQHVTACPGLYRIEINSAKDETRSRAAALVDDLLYDGLTEVTERSSMEPTVAEQAAALRRRGVL